MHSNLEVNATAFSGTDFQVNTCRVELSIAVGDPLYRICGVQSRNSRWGTSFFLVLRVRGPGATGGP